MKNERRDFLKKACAPVALTLLGIPLAAACSTEDDGSDPLSEGPLEIDLSNSQFRALEEINGWMNYTAEKLLLIRISSSEILAFNNACPHQGNRNSWSLQGGSFVCANHGREYEANCNSSLRCYNTQISGNILTVSR